MRLICASKRNETAKPAASSSGETSFEPDERRANDFASIALDSPSKRALLWADIFVLITIRLLPLSLPRYRGNFIHGIHAVGQISWALPVIPLALSGGQPPVLRQGYNRCGPLKLEEAVGIRRGRRGRVVQTINR